MKLLVQLFDLKLKTHGRRSRFWWTLNLSTHANKSTRNFSPPKQVPDRQFQAQKRASHLPVTNIPEDPRPWAISPWFPSMNPTSGCKEGWGVGMDFHFTDMQASGEKIPFRFSPSLIFPFFWFSVQSLLFIILYLPLQQPLVLRIISWCGQQKIITNSNKSNNRNKRNKKNKQNLNN